MRTTIGFSLLLLVILLGYQFFFKPKPTTPPAENQAQTQAADAAQRATAPAEAGVASAAATPSVAAALETETTIENEQYKIVFTNRGAEVKHWILKKYNDTAGKPLDMVQAQTAAQFGLPLSFFTYESNLTSQLNQALYQVTIDGKQPAAGAVVLAPTTLSFHYAANGLDVMKTFHFDGSYVIRAEAEVLRNGVPVRSLLQWPEIGRASCRERV